MKTLRICLVVTFAFMAGSLYAKKKVEEVKEREGPNPYVEIELPTRISSVIDRTDSLSAKIEHYDLLSMDGSKSAEKKAKKLIADRKKLAEGLDKVIATATKKENRAVDKLNKEIDKLDKQIEACGDDEEKKISDLSDKKKKKEVKVDALMDIAANYKMFTSYAKGGRPERTPYSLLKGMAPAFKGKTYDKEPQDVDFKGMQENYVIMVFFAVKHKSSLRALNEMVGVAKSSKEAELIAVCVDDDVEAAEQFVQGKKPKFPVVADPKGRVGNQFFVSFLPQILLIDPDGTVQRVQVGPSGKAKTAIRNQIKDLIKKAKADR